MENLKEFKELILLYESITVEKVEIAKVKLEIAWPVTTGRILKELSGFGSTLTCKLCLAIVNTFLISTCEDCIWKKETNKICSSGLNFHTYNNMTLAKTNQEIVDACYARAKYMRSVIE